MHIFVICEINKPKQHFTPSIVNLALKPILQLPEAKAI
jgi:hypothetical protein